MTTISELKQEIESLKRRNALVEAGKAWETSLTRRGLLMLFTYLAIGAYLYIIGIDSPWLHAIVPAVAFMLSTLTLPTIRKLWIRSHQRNAK